MARRVNWNDKGIEHERKGRIKQAEAAYRAALEAEPGNAGAWFNLGLLYKRLRRWEDSLRCNLRAVELDPENDGASWNLGIAATALGDWAHARDAWRRFGVDVPEGTGPFELPLGPVPIRLDPKGEPEIVWCRRLDPARAVIENVPLPTSGHRYRDLLLHDGAPNGYRELNGVKVPVFDEIQILQASRYTTFRTRIEVQSRGDVDVLWEQLEARDVSAEDWTTNIRRLCKACSEGTPHEHTPRGPSAERVLEMGVAAIDEAEASAIFQAWSAEGPGRSFEKLEIALEGSLRH
jgi:Tetratricopeptide repeat